MNPRLPHRLSLLTCLLAGTLCNAAMLDGNASAPERTQATENSVTLTTTSGSDENQASLTWPSNYPVPEGQALSIRLHIDPETDDAINSDVDAGLTIGLSSAESDANRFTSKESTIVLEIKEGHGGVRHSIYLDGKNLSFWGRPRERDYGLANISTLYEGGYDVRIDLVPRGDETGVYFYFDHTDRPLKIYDYDAHDAFEAELKQKAEANGINPSMSDKAFQAFRSEESLNRNHWRTEWTLNRPLTEANFIGVYARQGGGNPITADARFSNLEVTTIPIEEAGRWLPADEFVMGNLDYDHPKMTEVKAARDAGDMEKAKELFIDIFRNRTEPVGAPYNQSWARRDEDIREGEHNWKDVSEAAIEGRYAQVAWWVDLESFLDENGNVYWNRCTGFLTRFYHWMAMCYAYEQTGDDRYMQRAGEEVIDYVQREPYIWYSAPGVGGQLDWHDGSTLAEHSLWTGNVGRRLELTWWQAFEIFRKSEGFSDEAMFHFLDSVIRQCRLLENATVFKEWDDSGLHGAMALAKSSMLFNMCDEADRWAEVGWKRLNRIVDIQFHPDGSHVSLSSGYNWATIRGFEEFLEYMHLNHAEVQEKMELVIQGMYFHPLMLSRPDFGNIDLNDGGWSRIEDPVTKALTWFPDRKDYLFFETAGKEGIAPDPASIYFPNAGQYVMRTGWGPEEQYMFFDAGPWGASHGKQDGLNIYAQYGHTLLIRSAGRADYSGTGNTIHAGKSLSFNTLSPDWAEQNRIPHWNHEKALGFNPPKRRWVDNEQYAYGEGAFQYGWHSAKDMEPEHIKDHHIRQTVFVKGDDARHGYYLVLDTVEAKTDKLRTWRHPWHLTPDDMEINASSRRVLAKNSAAALEIIPIDPSGRMQLTSYAGQEKPALLGWRVHGKIARPWKTPTHEWQSNETFSNGYVIQMNKDPESLPIESVRTVRSEPGELLIEVTHKNGATDYLVRRFPGAEPMPVAGVQIKGDFGIVSKNAEGLITGILDLTDGEDSVAKSTL